jgi:hypothetical protein
VRQPDIVGVTSLCLRGLGAELSDDWDERINGRLRLPIPVAPGAGGVPGVMPRRRTAK